MDRRNFISATIMATAAGAATAVAGDRVPAGTAAGAAAEGTEGGEPRSRRWIEQRWLVDNIIQANGIDWDQPRSFYWNVPCGPEAGGDFAIIRNRVKKYADASPAFEWTARRREARAKAAEQEGSTTSARDNYFMAAIHWGAAQWPIDENNARNLFLNERKRDCYSRYAKLADHHVEAVWIPYRGKQLPAWFHLPPGYNGGRLPAMVFVPGMDSFKEGSVSLYGDIWLSRGFAVLAVELPGQYECPILGIHVNVPGFGEAGRAYFDWLAKRPEVDPERVGVYGLSFGSLGAIVVGGSEPRYRAVASQLTCLEPGFHCLLDEASPTFKQRFMYMSGYTDEAAFEPFRKTLTWEGYADKIRVPYLCIAGECDELSPMEYAEKVMKTVGGPKRLVVYAEARHALGAAPSATLGPNAWVYAADWMQSTLSGKTFPNERWFIDPTGGIHKVVL